MKSILRILLATTLVLASIEVSGQRWRLMRYEADVYLGGVAFHGDIGLADKPLANMFNGFRPSVGFTPRYFLRQNLAISLDLGYIIYGGKDKPGSSHNRVYSFNSHAFQHFARVEYYIFGEAGGRGGNAIYNRRGMINNFNRINLYAFGGGGGILSKATVRDENGEEPLNNLAYDNSLHYALGFPIGAGFKMSIDPRWSAGIELGYQFTLTDWLDGYSSEWSNYNDSYYLLTIKAIYRIRNDRNGKPVFTRYYR